MRYVQKAVRKLAKESTANSYSLVLKIAGGIKKVMAKEFLLWTWVDLKIVGYY